MKFRMEADIICGVAYEVEAETEEDARQIMREALIDHLNEGCDGIEIAPSVMAYTIELGVRRPAHDSPRDLAYGEPRLEYYDLKASS